MSLDVPAVLDDRRRSPWMLVRDFPNTFRRRVSGVAYRPEIDGLRFFAIAIVVVGHFFERAFRFFPAAREQADHTYLGDLIQHAGLGVYLFFTISGFILTGQAIKSGLSPLSLKFLRPYFGRRLFRIEPPYVILLCGTWLLIVLTGYVPEKTNHFDVMPHTLGISLLSSIFYIHDLVWGTYPRLFPPGWSLEIEVQFYILSPLLFWTYFRVKRRPFRLVLGALGMFLGLMSSIFAPGKIDEIYLALSILHFFHFFWLGIILADCNDWLVAKARTLSAPVATFLGWGGLLLFLVIPATPETFVMHVMSRVMAWMGITAMFVSAFAPQSRFRAVCVTPWISLIGGACYSIYLTHIQTLQAVTGLLAKLVPTGGILSLFGLAAIELTIVILVGLTFYVLIERPFMNPDRQRRAWSRVSRNLHLRFQAPSGGG